MKEELPEPTKTSSTTRRQAIWATEELRFCPRMHLRLRPAVLWVIIHIAGTLSLSAMDIIAHRGASYDAPENSLSSMTLAWQQGADGIETDIHLSRDGHIVVIHDADTKRVAGTNRRIAVSSWDQLKDLDIGRRKNVRWTGEKIPTLDSLLATISEGKCIFIELKVDARILPVLKQVISASGKTSAQMRLITFDLETAQAAKIFFPSHHVYWLVGYVRDETTGQMPDLDDLIREAKSAKLDGLDLDKRFSLDATWVRRIHAAGLQIHVWVVDDPGLATELEAAGVDSITTNRPELLRAQMRRRPSTSQVPQPVS